MEQYVCLKKISVGDCVKIVNCSDRGAGRSISKTVSCRLTRSATSNGTTANRSKAAVALVKSHSKDDIGGTLKALQSRSRFPKKWLGQHYMVKETVNTQVVDAAQIQPGDLVLEIGPGTGSLTESLVSAGADVVAVEKDPDMAYLVTERFHESDQVQVVHKDFMKWPVTSEMRKLLAQRDKSRAKVVSNLPFNITTNVIKRLLPMGDVFSEVILLLQEEAALRLTNRSPAPDDYRPITLVVNFFSVPEYLFKVSRKAFFPQPRVDGGVVAFHLKQQWDYPPVGEPKPFFSMVDSAFNAKRKMLRSSLQHLFRPSDVEAALASVSLPAESRPEELTLEQFVTFYNSAVALTQPPSTLQ